jgi:hypothetical protein
MDHHRNEKSENVEQTTMEGEPERTDAEAQWDEAELKITVRKLEVPARPRGVLAE